MEPPLTAWKEFSGLLGTGATAMLQQDHKSSLEHKACEVAQPSTPPTSACKGSTPSCTAHSALSTAPVLMCSLRHYRQLMLWSTSNLQLLCGPPSTEPVAQLCVPVCITAAGSPNKGAYGEICVMQKEKHDYEPTDSVLPSSWLTCC